jgi:hypothetical protein
MGRCPECGTFFDRVTGENVIRPLTPDQRSDMILRRVRTLALLIAAVSVLVCSGLLSWLHGAPRPFWVGAFVAGVLLLGALTSYVYEKDDG